MRGRSGVDRIGFLQVLRRRVGRVGWLLVLRRTEELLFVWYVDGERQAVFQNPDQIHTPHHSIPITRVSLDRNPPSDLMANKLECHEQPQISNL
jgi:hypothetical protein